LELKIAGRIVQVLEEQSGEGRNGPWRKQDFVLETEGDYPAKVCITQWGDDIEKFGVGRASGSPPTSTSAAGSTTAAGTPT
jgi:hypothetical protein